MKKIVNIIALVGVFSQVLISCSTQKEVANQTISEKSDEKPEVGTTENTETNDPITNDTLFAKIERGACFGTCPIYVLEIYKSGYAVYTGKRFTEKTGIFEAQVTADEMKQLLQKAEDIKFAEMNDVYDGKVTDLPSTTTSIVINGKLKTVYRRYNFPREILKFEELFDALIEAHEWTKIGDIED